MNRAFLVLAVLLSISLVLTACRRDAQPDPLPEAEVEVAAEPEPEPQQPTVPMCGDFVVVVEQPTVVGDADGGRILRSLLDGLRAAGCEAHTSRPPATPAGVAVIQLAPRVQPLGDAANLMVIATDTSTGQVHSRHQERVTSGDGTAQARLLGERIAQRLAN